VAYSFVTLAQAQADLQARLYNTVSSASQQFWTPAELTTYLQEALRTWNSLTSTFRDTFSFPLSPGVQWYDLTSVGGSLRPMTLTDATLLLQLEYHLLEPLTTLYPLSWAGSSQFGITNLLDAIGTARDETLSETGCTLTRSLVASGGGRTTLLDSVLDIQRLAWLPNAGLGYLPVALESSDLQEKQDFDFAYASAGSQPPETYLQSSDPPLAFDVDYTPPVPGRFEVLSVNAGGAESASTITPLGVPDDWSWVVKFGALEELFSREGLAKDPLRADYSARRFQQGKELLKDAPALLSITLNGQALQVDAVRNGDDYNSGWQGTPAGQPTDCYIAGLNLLGFETPDAGSYTIGATVVENAPVPSAGTDYLQVGRDSYEVVLDYAQHLAALKLGGEEFQKTLPLFQNFLAFAGTFNAKLRELGFFQRPMYETSQLQEERSPVWRKDESR